MGHAEFSFDIDGRGEFSDVARALGQADRSLPLRFRKSIEREAKVLKKEAAAKALTERSAGGKPYAGKGIRGGLRRAVAQGIDITKTEDGVIITTSVPGGPSQAPIPRGLDTVRGWRHPVFGKKNTWVTQQGYFSWFTETMENANDRLVAQFERDLDESVDKIDNAAKA